MHRRAECFSPPDRTSKSHGGRAVPSDRKEVRFCRGGPNPPGRIPKPHHRLRWDVLNLRMIAAKVERLKVGHREYRLGTERLHLAMKYVSRFQWKRSASPSSAIYITNAAQPVFGIRVPGKSHAVRKRGSRRSLTMSSNRTSGESGEFYFPEIGA